jgi:hypothetical protein
MNKHTHTFKTKQHNTNIKNNKNKVFFFKEPEEELAQRKIIFNIKFL